MSRFVIGATWDDAPHLSPEAKAKAWALAPPYQRAARARGIPQLGAGVIYPIPEEDILFEPRDIDLAPTWPHGFGMDVGWNRTAGLWAAQDPKTKVIYVFSEHYRGEAEPSTHAQAWRGRGLWIPGVIDPASRGRSQVDGQRLIDLYLAQGLILQPATNAVETGIATVYALLSSGMLKIARTLTHFRSEYRVYQRDTKGKVVKKRDHLMDCLRYLTAEGTGWWKPRPLGWQNTAPGTQPLDPLGVGLSYDGPAVSADSWMRL